MLEFKVPIEIHSKGKPKIKFNLEVNPLDVKKLVRDFVRELNENYPIPSELSDMGSIIRRLKSGRKLDILKTALNKYATYKFFKNPRSFRIKGIRDLVSFTKIKRPEELKRKISRIVSTTDGDLIDKLSVFGEVEIPSMGHLMWDYLGWGGMGAVSLALKRD